MFGIRSMCSSQKQPLTELGSKFSFCGRQWEVAGPWCNGSRFQRPCLPFAILLLTYYSTASTKLDNTRSLPNFAGFLTCMSRC